MAKGFGRVQKRCQKLEKCKDRLSELNEVIPWEVFRSCLDQLGLQERKSKGGRKPIDRLILFKLLILQQLYNVSDEELEYQTHDRASFRRFLGLAPAAAVPDAKTIWLFRKRLTEAGLIEELFQQFEQFLPTAGYEAKGGQMIDATLVPVPIQRHSREENQPIKNGETPAAWEKEPYKLSQKDVDARWTQKNGNNDYGYKKHINVDVADGFIRQHSVTDAAVHDSQELETVLDDDNADDGVWADSAYRSEETERTLEIEEYESHIHEKARNRPLGEAQKASNREKSKIRAKVEHVFGGWVTSMGGKMVRCIGLERVSAYLGLKDLTFNLKRYVFWQKRENCRLSVPNGEN
ncbi:IS5 family transposase [bacterium]|nr:IS5 family transposase [bacterium]